MSKDDYLSFISEGSQSEARHLIKEDGVRRYQAFSLMGLATVGDAASQDGRLRASPVKPPVRVRVVDLHVPLREQRGILVQVEHMTSLYRISSSGEAASWEV